MLPPASASGERWPGQVPLRPLRIGEILGVGLRLGWRNLPVIGPLSLLVGALGSAALIGVLTANGMVTDYLAVLSGSIDVTAMADNDRAMRILWISLLASFSSAVVSQLFSPLLAGIAAPMVAGAATGVRQGSTLSRLRGRWLLLLLVSVSSGAAVSVGLVALAVPGILIWLALLPAGPAAAMEGGTVGGVLRRAARLSQHLRARMLGVLVLTAVISAVIGTIAAVLFSQIFLIEDAETAFYLGQAVAIVVGAFTGTWSATVVALLYVDARMRKENLGPVLWEAAHRAKLSAGLSDGLSRD